MTIQNHASFWSDPHCSLFCATSLQRCTGPSTHVCPILLATTWFCSFLTFNALWFNVWWFLSATKYWTQWSCPVWYIFMFFASLTWVMRIINEARVSDLLSCHCNTFILIGWNESSQSSGWKKALRLWLIQFDLLLWQRAATIPFSLPMASYAASQSMQYHVHLTKCYTPLCPSINLAAFLWSTQVLAQKFLIWALTFLFWWFVISIWLFAPLSSLDFVEYSLSLFTFWVSKCWLIVGGDTSEPSSELELSPKISSISIVLWIMFCKKF